MNGPAADPPAPERPLTPPVEKVEKAPRIAKHVVDEDGDLVLRVGNNARFLDEVCDFLVCSSTMRRSSPVWRKMLFGEFREAKPADGEWIVALPDDNSRTMKVLLHITHAKFSQVPCLWFPTDIYNLVVVMDKYDALSLMKPWAKDWLAIVSEPTKPFIRGTGVYSLCIDAYIALQMGAESVAYNLVSSISRNMSIDKAGKPTVDGTHLASCGMLDTVGPHSMFDIIRTMREAQIKHLVVEVWRVVNAKMTATRSAPPNPLFTSRISSEDISFDFLGRFWCAVTEKRGGLLPTSSHDITESPTELIASLQAVVDKMGPKHSHDFFTALTPLGDDVLRRHWKADAEFMSSRRKASGILQ